MHPITTSRALIVNPKKEVLLVRRSASDPKHPGKWDIPGGRAEPGEDLRAAAIRETLEEVGIQLRDPQLIFAISAPRPEGTGTWLFFAEQAPAGAVVTLSDEHDTYKWVPWIELPNYASFEVLLRMHAFVTEHSLLEVVA